MSTHERRQMLATVQKLCRSFGRNMAYYRAAWAKAVRPLFENNPSSGNFWNTANGNFLDMCVLEWCKLFGGSNEVHSWIRATTDPDAFKSDLLRHLEIDQQAFDGEIRIFREYRDKWAAHQDRDRAGMYPRLEIAKKAAWFYYEQIRKEQPDPEIGSKTIEQGYSECEAEASMVYLQAIPVVSSNANVVASHAFRRSPETPGCGLVQSEDKPHARFRGVVSSPPATPRAN